MPNLIDTFGYFTEDDRNFTIINFGKHKGERASDHKRYLEWMQLQDFPEDVQEIVEEVLSEVRR